MNLRTDLVEALKSKTVAIATAFSLGAAMPILIIGNPTLLDRPAAADWASALASFAAAAVALGLGVHAVIASRHEQDDRRRSAVAALLPSVGTTLAIAQAISESADDIRADAESAEHWRARLAELPPILPPEVLPFLPMLSSNIASSAVIVADRNQIIRGKMERLKGDPGLATLVIEEAHFVAHACLPFGNRLYGILFPGAIPPWSVELA